MLWISAIVAFIILVIGSITDFQKREVHDYVSYFLIFAAFGISAVYSIISQSLYIVQTAMGFLLGLGIAYAMFYLGQWGGGDSKLIMGLGAVFGFNISPMFGEKNLLFILLLASIIIAGAIYGLFYSIYLAIRHRKAFMQNIRKWSERKEIRNARIAMLCFLLVSALIIIFFVPREYKLMLLSLIAVLFLIFYIWLFI